MASNSASQATADLFTKERVFGFIGVGLLAGAFGTATSYLGSKEDYNQIKDKIWIIVGIAIGGAAVLALATILYYLQNPTGAAYFQTIVTTLAMGMSFAALAMAAITR